MSRSVRIELLGALYHVMCRGLSRLPVFLYDKDREHFLDGLQGIIEDGDSPAPPRSRALCGDWKSSWVPRIVMLKAKTRSRSRSRF